MQELRIGGYPQPELVIPGGDEGRIKQAEPVVQFSPPHRLRPGHTIVKQPASIEFARLESAPDWRRAKRGVFLVRDSHAGVGYARFRMEVQRPGKSFERVRGVTVVGIGVGEVFPAGEANGAVPRSVERFALVGSQVVDVWMPLLELLDDAPLVLGRCCIHHDDLNLRKDRLCYEVFKAPPHESLGAVSRDDSGDFVWCGGHWYALR